jgi:hypothetical protein
MFVNQQMAKRNSNGRKNDDVVSHPVREWATGKMFVI